MKLKKTLIILVSVAIVSVCFVGCVEPPKTEFSLKSWEVIDDNGAPSLIMSFNASNDVWIHVTDPDGVETDFRKRIENGITGAKLCLAGYKEIPQAGTYTLIVKDKYGDIIFTKEISFIGIDVSITKCTPSWKYYKWSDKYTLDSLTISVKNEGDLPAYIDKADVTIDGKVSSLLLSEVVLPNQDKTIAKNTHINDIMSGEHEMTVILKDRSKNTVSTYTTEAVPSK
ncbi:MAG: hypothetical protein SYNGOMJ08_00461 [Candidatus Syntrophoarchaeum sp. GoM_oil]|nr:MAG: hypothetical protein SYNGOMJ08_00461 [Candidatus Syntrophoarchaeum sp. GoM_oil]